MTLLTLTPESLEPTLAAADLAFLSVSTDTCYSCSVMHDSMVDAAGDRDDVVLATIDFDAHPELMREMQVSAVPTWMVFREGVLVRRSEGGLSRESLDTVLAWAQGLDMPAIHAELDREGGSATLA